MYEPSTDELLSAYLDGELTAEEQVRAERLLAENPEARRLHAELQSMRSCLQGMSPQQLPDDFSGRVLRAAEQRMLAEPKGASSPASEAKDDRPGWQERLRRPLAYALIVLAASVLIAVFVPGTSKESGPEVAMSPQPTAPSMQPPPTIAELAEGMDDQTNVTQMAVTNSGIGDQVKLDDAADFDGSLLVVTCELTPDAARKDAFRQVLVKNQIVLGDNEASARNRGAPGPGVSADGFQAAKKSGDRGSGLEMVYVEATKEQLEATLTEISNTKEDFLSVDVGPTETQVTQNRWQRDYSRGRGNLVQQRVLLQPAEDQSGTQGGRAPTTPVPTNPAQTAATPATEGKQPLGNLGQQSGRARGYSMPTDNLATQRAKGRAEEEQVDKPQPIAKGGAQLGKDGAAAEPGTLRALFVLRVAEDQKPAVAPAKPAAAPQQP